MKLLHQNPLKSIYQLELWRNHYNRDNMLDPLFASHCIVSWEDNKYLESDIYKEKIDWTSYKGLFAVGDKKCILSTYDKALEYIKDKDGFYRMSLFQSLTYDLALILADSEDKDFSNLLHTCSWNHISNVTPLEAIKAHDCKLSQQLLEHIDSYQAKRKK